MCPRIRALELPPPTAALRDVDPVPRSRSFLWRSKSVGHQGEKPGSGLFRLETRVHLLSRLVCCWGHRQQAKLFRAQSRVLYTIV